MTATKGSEPTTSATKGKAAMAADLVSLLHCCASREQEVDLLVAALEGQAAIHEEELREARELLERWRNVAGLGMFKQLDIDTDAFLGASQQIGTPPAVGSPLCWDCGQGWPGVDTGVLGNGERICVNCKCPTNREVLGDGPPAESETAETCRRCKGAGTTPGSYYHAEGLCGDMPCPDCGGSGTTKGGTR